MTGAPRLLPCGDTAFSVDFGNRIAPDFTARVMALDRAVQAEALPGVIETVPTYRALMVIVDPLRADRKRIENRVRELAALPVGDLAKGRLWRVPVVYGGRWGEDLDAIADHCGLNAREYILRHAAGEYTVAMIGFQPGFSYLSGLDPELAMPRRTEPRLRVPASSISVGGEQTAIGSVESPSGWHLIGRTPVRAFQPGRDPLFLFQPGDRIRFVACAQEEWPDMQVAADAGETVAERLA